MPVPMQGPLGQYGIARSLVQTPGWKALEAEQNEMLPGGGGGGGFGFSMGPQQRGYNDMERTLLAHDEPGHFKVTTDQYAAKYSDQLDAWALEEMKQKFPQGPKGGGTWEQEFARQAALKNSGKPWGVPEHLQKKISLGKNSGALKLINARKVAGPLSGVADRDRSGLSNSGGSIAAVTRRGGSARAKAQRAAAISRQNKSAIANRPTSSAAAYTNFGRFR